MVNLSPQQQQEFIELYNADKCSGPRLKADRKQVLNDLKNQIVHGIPLNSKHPGVINLCPDQKRHLIAIEKKQSR